jgi:TonB family protein
VSVWFDAQGRITRVEAQPGSGVLAYDAEVRRVLLAMTGLRPPPASALGRMPIHFAIDERRPL